MEEEIPHQDSLKGRSQSVFKLRGNNNAVHRIAGKVFNGVLPNRFKDAVDPHLRDRQTEFRKNRSCTDQIVTLRIMLEQSLEWNSPLYVNIIQNEKALDNTDRKCLRKLLRHYEIPSPHKITNIIGNSY